MLLDDTYFMREAIKEAIKARDRDEVPVGAVIVANQKVIARGHNLTETLKDVTAHAEMQAITAAANAIGGKYLNDCVIYVTLEPCTMCAGALGWSQIGKVVIGARDEKRGFLSSLHKALHPKTEILTDVLAEDCAELLRAFFRKKRL